MKRSVVATVALVALLLSAIAVVGAVAGDRDASSDDRGPGMMSQPSDWGGDQRPRGPGDWMHQTIGSELEYLAEMVAHHQEPVDAAEQLQRSQRPRMREFATSIIATQSAQIDQMNRGLADWYPGRPTEVDYQPMMRDLSGLSGDRLNRAFLHDMIRHHMAAVMMSQQLLARGLAAHSEVNALARSIREEQLSEVFQMRQWLVRWYGDDWRHGPGRPMGPGMMW